MSKTVKYSMIAVAFFVVIFIVGGLFKAKTNLPSFAYDDVKLVQLETPKKGQEIAIIDTTVGTFKVALYREYAPKTVESFVKLAKEGFYDGKYIFSARKDLYFLAGTTNQDGVIVKKDEPNYEKEMTKTDNEINKNLWTFKGSLISFGPDIKGNGVYFSGINTIEYTDKIKEQMKESKNANMDIVNAFLEKGGNPMLSGQFTVFAQTYEGLDVFEKICNVPVKDEKNYFPADELKINSIKISTFE